MTLARRLTLVATLAFVGLDCRPAAVTGTTRIESAPVQHAEVAPSLPIFVLRLARDEVELSTLDRAGVAMIVEEAEFYARTLDRARAAYLEVLARSVEAGSLDETSVAILSDQLVWASRYVAPYLEHDLTELHELLRPEEQAAVTLAVRAQYARWARAWAADGTEPPRWVEGLARGDISDLEASLVRTAQTWAARREETVRTALPLLDPSQRAALASSLRRGGVD